jgi:hypothetical protein
VAGRQNRFEWDEANRGHIARHGVTPEEFEQGMNGNPLELGSAEINGELRTKVAAITARGRVLEMIYTIRRGRIRAVTAFPVDQRKKERYRVYFEK